MSAPVQPIIVRIDVPENHLILDAAIASVKAYEHVPSGYWESWTSGRFTKSVRKVSPSQLASWAQEFGLAMHGTAAAGAPLPYEEYPKRIAKARVEGWSDQVLQWDDSTSTGDITIVLNADLDMTPGKAAAQAAHALTWWHLESGTPVEEVLVAIVKESFSSMDRLPKRTIFDAGLTEIAPNSPTAFVV